MEVRNKIWEEFKQAKANVVCIRRYNSVQRQLNCIYQIFIAVCAAVGTFSFGFSDKIPFVALLSIAIVSLIKAIFPQIIQPEQELCELDGIILTECQTLCEVNSACTSLPVIFEI